MSREGKSIDRKWLGVGRSECSWPQKTLWAANWTVVTDSGVTSLRHFIVFLKCKLKLSTLTGQVIWVFMLFCLTHQGRVFQTKFSMSGSSLQCPVGTSGAALEQGKREHTLPLRLQQ